MFTTSEFPASAVAGMSARLACTSDSISSSPSPTVNTGTVAARSGSSASPITSSVLSPPSETTTIAESGTPCSSSRAWVSADPSRVRLPLKVSPSTPSIRDADDEKRKYRSAKPSSSAGTRPLSGSSSATAFSAREVPSRSSIVMLRESSTSTATKLRCGTIEVSTRAGCITTRKSTAKSAVRSVPSTQRSVRLLRPRASV